MEVDPTQDAVTEAEKLSIANHLLKSSPPGQFNDVLEDVRKLVPSSVLTADRVASVAKAYNADTARVIKNGDHSFVLAREGEIDSTHYVDTVIGKVVEVDHLAAEAVPGSTQADAPQGATEPLRAALEAALKAYREGQFAASACSSAAFAVGADTFVLYVSGEQLNLRNWWSGSWVGRYEVKLQSGGAVLSGSIAVCGHYFENGNMQLRSQRSVPPVELPLPAGSDSPAAIAAAIVGAVRSAEDSLQAALEEMYASMSESTLRSMRRAVPVNAERFSWQIAQIRMRNTLIASRK